MIVRIDTGVGEIEVPLGTIDTGIPGVELTQDSVKVDRDGTITVERTLKPLVPVGFIEVTFSIGEPE